MEICARPAISVFCHRVAQLKNTTQEGEVVCMVGVVRIVTHHNYLKDVVRAWYREGVCAVGYVYDPQYMNLDYEGIREYRLRTKRAGDRRTAAIDARAFITFRDEVQIGDLIFAYVGNNIVGLVGEVTGKARFYTENGVGSPDGKFYYPNQRLVDWWPEPQMFERYELPDEISEWVAGRDTISRRAEGGRELGRIVRRIKSGRLLDF